MLQLREQLNELDDDAIVLVRLVDRSGRFGREIEAVVTSAHPGTGELAQPHSSGTRAHTDRTSEAFLETEIPDRGLKTGA